jgi:hypothetical protein
MSLIARLVSDLLRILKIVFVGFAVAVAGALFHGLLLTSALNLPLSFPVWIGVVIVPALLFGGYFSARTVAPRSVAYPAIAAAIPAAAWAIIGGVTPLWLWLPLMVAGFVATACVGVFIARFRQRVV